MRQRRGCELAGRCGRKGFIVAPRTQLRPWEVLHSYAYSYMITANGFMVPEVPALCPDPGVGEDQQSTRVGSSRKPVSELTVKEKTHFSIILIPFRRET